MPIFSEDDSQNNTDKDPEKVMIQAENMALFSMGNGTIRGDLRDNSKYYTEFELKISSQNH